MVLVVRESTTGSEIISRNYHFENVTKKTTVRDVAAVPALGFAIQLQVGPLT